MKYELPQGYSNRPWDYEGELYIQSQMQAAYQAGRDSVRYEGELPELPAPEYRLSPDSKPSMYDLDQMKDYARQAIAGYRAKVGQSEPAVRSARAAFESSERCGYAYDCGSYTAGYEQGKYDESMYQGPAPAAANQGMLEALKNLAGYMKCIEAVFREGRMYLDMTLVPSLVKSAASAIAQAEAQPAQQLELSDADAQLWLARNKLEHHTILAAANKKAGL
jgi:hypothetical protein